jgi:hypothetical protein
VPSLAPLRLIEARRGKTRSGLIGDESRLPRLRGRPNERLTRIKISSPTAPHPNNNPTYKLGHASPLALRSAASMRALISAVEPAA